MTWEGYWLPNLLQWTIGPVFTVLIGLYLKRLLRLNREQVERVVDVVEGMVGGVRASPTGRVARPVQSAATEPRETLMPDLARFRKAIGAGAGVLLIGLLTYATTSTELRGMLESLLPAWAVPLVGVLIGGLTTVLAVIRSTNAPEPSPYRRAATGPQPVTVVASAPPADEQRPQLAPLDEPPAGTTPSSPARSEPPRADPMPATRAGDVDELAATGIVQLATVPSLIDYR